MRIEGEDEDIRALLCVSVPDSLFPSLPVVHLVTVRREVRNSVFRK
jgi:hypothetical protein